MERHQLCPWFCADYGIRCNYGIKWTQRYTKNLVC